MGCGASSTKDEDRDQQPDDPMEGIQPFKGKYVDEKRAAERKEFVRQRYASLYSVHSDRSSLHRSDSFASNSRREREPSIGVSKSREPSVSRSREPSYVGGQEGSPPPAAATGTFLTASNLAKMSQWDEDMMLYGAGGMENGAMLPANITDVDHDPVLGSQVLSSGSQLLMTPNQLGSPRSATPVTSCSPARSPTGENVSEFPSPDAPPMGRRDSRLRPVFVEVVEIADAALLSSFNANDDSCCSLHSQDQQPMTATTPSSSAVEASRQTPATYDPDVIPMLPSVIVVSEPSADDGVSGIDEEVEELSGSITNLPEGYGCRLTHSKLVDASPHKHPPTCHSPPPANLIRGKEVWRLQSAEEPTSKGGDEEHNHQAGLASSLQLDDDSDASFSPTGSLSPPNVSPRGGGGALNRSSEDSSGGGENQRSSTGGGLSPRAGAILSKSPRGPRSDDQVGGEKQSRPKSATSVKKMVKGAMPVYTRAWPSYSATIPPGVVTAQSVSDQNSWGENSSSGFSASSGLSGTTLYIPALSPFTNQAPDGIMCHQPRYCAGSGNGSPECPKVIPASFTVSTQPSDASYLPAGYHLPAALPVHPLRQSFTPSPEPSPRGDGSVPQSSSGTTTAMNPLSHDDTAEKELNISFSPEEAANSDNTVLGGTSSSLGLPSLACDQLGDCTPQSELCSQQNQTISSLPVVVPVGLLKEDESEHGGIRAQVAKRKKKTKTQTPIFDLDW